MPFISQHQRIAESLRADIAAGVYQPGQQLPSLRKLAEKYGTSTHPPRTAINTLYREGLVQVIISSGAYVSKRREV